MSIKNVGVYFFKKSSDDFFLYEQMFIMGLLFSLSSFFFCCLFQTMDKYEKVQASSRMGAFLMNIATFFHNHSTEHFSFMMTSVHHIGFGPDFERFSSAFALDEDEKKRVSRSLKYTLESSLFNTVHVEKCGVSERNFDSIKYSLSTVLWMLGEPEVAKTVFNPEKFDESAYQYNFTGDPQSIQELEQIMEKYRSKPQQDLQEVSDREQEIRKKTIREIRDHIQELQKNKSKNKGLIDTLQAKMQTEQSCYNSIEMNKKREEGYEGEEEE